MTEQRRLDTDTTAATLRTGEEMEQERAAARVADFIIRLPLHIAEGMIDATGRALDKLGQILSQGDTR